MSKQLTRLQTSFVFCLTATLALVFGAPTVEARSPNILFIFLDDFGWRDTSYMGSDFYETPHLDALAAQGMTFSQAYSCAANCAPARACLLSGQYTPRHRIFNVGTGPRGKAKYRRLMHVPGVKTLDPKIRTWAHQLQKAGYQTATMGKWHLSKDPVPYGFHVNIGGTHSGGPPRGYYPPHGKVPGLENAPPGEYVTDRLSEEAIRFIRANKDRPWALYLTHFAVHTPLNAKRELVAKYSQKKPGKLHRHVAMATMIQAVDDGVGRIQAALDELNLTDNTVVLFFSDNGGYGPATDMAPLKGYKGTYYEGGIREPFFVKWPGVVKAGGKSDEQIIGVDLYPTICEMAGAALPSGQPLDGVSLVPLLKGDKKTLGERPLFWHFPAYLQSYSGLHDEQRDPLFRSRPCSIIRLGDWKLHQYFEDGGLELYNLADDVGETKNLTAANPAKTKELLDRLVAWRKQINAPVPSKPNPQFDEQAHREAIAKVQSNAGAKKVEQEETEKTEGAGIRLLTAFARIRSTRGAGSFPSIEPMQIKIFSVGGTIDKVYFDKLSDYQVGQPGVGEMLADLPLDGEFAVESLMRKDSLDMTDEDRELIWSRVADEPCSKILITHGTDTIIETARGIRPRANTCVVLTGALQPANFKSSDAMFNIGMAIGVLAALDSGVHIVMNGRRFDPHHWQKEPRSRPIRAHIVQAARLAPLPQRPIHRLTRSSWPA